MRADVSYRLLCLGIVFLIVRAAHAATPGDIERCAAAKRLLAATKIRALTICDAKAVARGGAVSPTCEAKAKAEFVVGWSKVENDLKGSCPTIGEVNVVEQLVDQHQTDLEQFPLGIGSPSQCAAAQFRAAGRNAAGKLRCAARAARRSVLLDDPAIAECLTASRAKFTAALKDAERRHGACHARSDVQGLDEVADAFVNDVSNRLPATTTTTAPRSTTSTTLTPCTPSDGACTGDGECCTGLCNRGRCDCTEQEEISGITGCTCGGGVLGLCTTDKGDGRHVCAASCPLTIGCTTDADCPPHQFCGLRHFGGVSMFQIGCCSICPDSSP